MRLYYATKAITIALAAAIPVMTTINAWPWTIAIVGSLIAALEGISQLWHFHERYVAARVVLKSLDREQIMYRTQSGDYADPSKRDGVLAEHITALLDRYESQVLSVLEKPSDGAASAKVGT